MPKSSFSMSFLNLKIYPSIPIYVNILRDHLKFCKCMEMLFKLHEWLYANKLLPFFFFSFVLLDEIFKFSIFII